MKSVEHCNLLLATLLLLATGCSTSQGPRLTLQQKELNLESFQLVWETARDKYYDPDLNGLDWNAIHKEYRPRVAQAEHMPEARTAMKDMPTCLVSPILESFPRRPTRILATTIRKKQQATITPILPQLTSMVTPVSTFVCSRVKRSSRLVTLQPRATNQFGSGGIVPVVR